MTSAHAQSSLPGSSAGRSAGPRCVIALDPGHNGEDTDEFDPVTGVRMIDYPNGDEDADALEITRAVESRLALVGIGTEVLKSSVDDDVTYRERVDRASAAGTFMGVSIHTTPGAEQSAIFPQRQGGYRAGTDAGGEHRIVTFDDPQMAAESQRLSGVVAGARSVLEGGEVPVRDNSFSGREPLWEGNLPVISLIAETPWIYNEFGSATGGGADGLTAAEKERYIDGLSAGLIAAAATSPACTGIGSWLAPRTRFSPPDPLVTHFRFLPAGAGSTATVAALEDIRWAHPRASGDEPMASFLYAERIADFCSVGSCSSS